MFYAQSFWTTEVWGSGGPELNDEPLYIFQMGPKSNLVKVFEPNNPEHIDSFHITSDLAPEQTPFEQFAMCCVDYAARQEGIEEEEPEYPCSVCECDEDEDSPYVCTECAEKFAEDADPDFMHTTPNNF